MRAERFRFDPEEIDRLVELVAERVVARLEERRALSSCGEPAAPTDVELAARIAAALDDGPVTVPELARRARLRDETVRKLVQSDPRFLPVPPPPGRSPKAKCWTLRLDSFSSGGRVRTNGSSRGRTGR
jgi:hypothetical protein